MTGLKFYLLVLTGLFASFKMMAEQQSVASIGNISELTGYAKVLRDKEYGAKIKLGINSYDDVRTSAGRLGTLLFVLLNTLN